MCVPVRAFARSFSTFRLFVHVCVCLCELLLGVSPRSGMCVPVRAVARSFSTLRLFLYDCTYTQWCLVFFNSLCVVGPFTVNL